LKFAHVAAKTMCKTALEIGAGLGHLTHLLAERFQRVIAIEKDESLSREMLNLMPSLDNVEIINMDASALDLENVPGVPPLDPADLVVVGNLPYMITSVILLNLFEQRRLFSNAILGIQQEVADRLCATPGSRAAGRLTLLLHAFMDVRKMFDLPPDAYVPRPRVSSSVIKLTPLDRPRIEIPSEAMFRKVVATAFTQRRKMLAKALVSNSLCQDLDCARQLLTKAGIDPKRRGETLSLDEISRLSMLLY